MRLFLFLLSFRLMDIKTLRILFGIICRQPLTWNNKYKILYIFWKEFWHIGSWRDEESMILLLSSCLEPCLQNWWCTQDHGVLQTSVSPQLPKHREESRGCSVTAENMCALFQASLMAFPSPLGAWPRRNAEGEVHRGRGPTFHYHWESWWLRLEHSP